MVQAEHITLVLRCSLREKYGRVFSIKLGSYKFVMASTPEAIKEMLVNKSADYAGRQQTFGTQAFTLGRFHAHVLAGKFVFPREARRAKGPLSVARFINLSRGVCARIA